MRQPSPNAFDAALARYISADRELAHAGDALCAFLASNTSAARARRAELQLAASVTSGPRPSEIELIQKIIAAHFALDPETMRSHQRPNHVAQPRQIAMALARELTRHPLTTIGSAFGGRDHGTVIWACRAVEARRETDATFRDEFENLRISVRKMLAAPKTAPVHG